MDVYLILGGENEESRPRCNAFLQFAREQAAANPRFFLESYVVCSGGRSLVSRPRVSESVLMREYLIAHDIPSKCILAEEESRDTLGNFVFSYPIIVDQLKATRVFLVTESFHATRGASIFRKIYGELPLRIIPAHNSSLVFSAARLKFWRQIYELTQGHPDEGYWQRLATQLSSFSRPSVVDYFILLAIEWDFAAYNVHSFDSARRYLMQLPAYGKDTLEDSAYAALIRKVIK